MVNKWTTEKVTRTQVVTLVDLQKILALLTCSSISPTIFFLSFSIFSYEFRKFLRNYVSTDQIDLIFSCRYVLSDLPSDIVIHVDDARFYLHKVIPPFY